MILVVVYDFVAQHYSILIIIDAPNRGSRQIKHEAFMTKKTKKDPHSFVRSFLKNYDIRDDILRDIDYDYLKDDAKKRTVKLLEAEKLNAELYDLDTFAADEAYSILQKRQEQLGEALEAATLNPDLNDYDTLVGLAADSIRQNKLMPEWLALFAADVLEGKKLRPVKPGVTLTQNLVRDFTLYRAAMELKQNYGFPLYTNNEEATKETAAEIVSKISGYSIDVVKVAIKKFKIRG
jgi:hypothetical protein